jgi:hypothetical protein
MREVRCTVQIQRHRQRTGIEFGSNVPTRWSALPWVHIKDKKERKKRHAVGTHMHAHTCTMGRGDINQGLPKKEADAGAPVVARVDGKGRWALENKEKNRQATPYISIPSWYYFLKGPLRFLVACVYGVFKYLKGKRHLLSNTQKSNGFVFETPPAALCLLLFSRIKKRQETQGGRCRWI